MKWEGYGFLHSDYGSGTTVKGQHTKRERGLSEWQGKAEEMDTDAPGPGPCKNQKGKTFPAVLAHH